MCMGVHHGSPSAHHNKRLYRWDANILSKRNNILNERIVLRFSTLTWMRKNIVSPKGESSWDNNETKNNL